MMRITEKRELEAAKKVAREMVEVVRSVWGGDEGLRAAVDTNTQTLCQEIELLWKELADLTLVLKDALMEKITPPVLLQGFDALPRDQQLMVLTCLKRTEAHRQMQTTEARKTLAEMKRRYMEMFETQPGSDYQPPPEKKTNTDQPEDNNTSH